jgi:uncharacterized membrane protein
VSSACAAGAVIAISSAASALQNLPRLLIVSLLVLSWASALARLFSAAAAAIGVRNSVACGSPGVNRSPRDSAIGFPPGRDYDVREA